MWHTDTRWFKYDRDWFVCKQAALHSSLKWQITLGLWLGRAKVVVLLTETKSVTAMHRRFQPARNTILSLFKTSEEKENHLHILECEVSSSCESILCGKLSTALANQQGRQLMSMECLSAQWKEYFKWIWKCSYTRISVVHKLSNNKERWLHFTDWADGKDVILFNTWFLDEAYFYLDRTVNKLSKWFWETESPENSHEKSSHRGKVTVWFTMTNHGLISPKFFKWNIKLRSICLCSRTTSCRNLSQMACFRRHSGLSRWCHATYCKCHAGFLEHCFWPLHQFKLLLDHHNCGNFWPPLSPKLNPCNFFLWGFLK